MNLLFAYLHHLAAFSLVACLFSQLILLSLPDTPPSTRLLRNIDAAYGLSALLLLLAGGLRAGVFEKTWSYYQAQPAFWLKLAGFALAGLLSIYPSLHFFKRARLTNAELATPRQIQIKIHLRRIKLGETGLVCLIIWQAICLAKGINYLN